MCLFCKIVDGDIPAYKIYEDDHVLAFLDISQVTQGHTLVIPKKHIQNIYELTPDISSPLFNAVPIISKALKKAFNPIGLNLINNNDKPLQSVFHFHLHLIPRYENDGMYVGLDKGIPNLEKAVFEKTQTVLLKAIKEDS